MKKVTKYFIWEITNLYNCRSRLVWAICFLKNTSRVWNQVDLRLSIHVMFHFFLISCTEVAWWRFCCHCLNTRHHKLRLRWLAKSKILVGKTIRGLETKSCWGKCCNPRNSNHNIEVAYISLPLSLCILFVYSLRSSIFSLV